MQVKENILRDIEALFNTNPEGIKFVLGRPAVLYDSSFVLERFGDPDTDPNENWYDVITEDFVAIALTNFDAGFISQPQVRAFSANITLNFFVNFEIEYPIIQAMENVIESLPGLQRTLPDGYRVTYSAALPRAGVVETYNDMRFIQYGVDLTLIAMEDLFSLTDVKVEIALPTAPNTFIELPVLGFSAVRGRDTTVIQRPNTNTGKSLIKNSVWTASLQFFLSTKTTPNLKIVTEEMIKIIEDNNKNQNAIFNLKTTYNSINYTVVKPVIVTAIQLDMTREEATSIGITVEEAYIEVLNLGSGGST
jgi:hypothetical protein